MRSSLTVLRVGRLWHIVSPMVASEVDDSTATLNVERSRDRKIALGVLLLSFVVYNANLRLVGSGDSYGTRLIPFAVWKAGTLHFDPVIDAAVQRDPNPYWIFPSLDGRPASLFPIVTPVVVTPLYAPAAFYLEANDWRQEDLERLASLMEKFSASLVTSIAAALMFVVLRRRLSAGDALLLTLVFAFGTNTWATSSQALWLHAVAELLAVVALWAITLEATRWRAFVAGAAIALLVCNRPPDLFLGLGLAVFGLFWARRRLGSFIAGGLVPGILVLTYNLSFFGHPLGAWGKAVGGSFFQHSILAGIGGLLVSPGRGLFVFSPVLLFLPVFFNRVFRDRERLLTICLSIAVVVEIIFYARTDWRAGWSYGPRYMVDTLPFMIWLMAPIVASLRRAERAVFAILFAISVAVQYIGAFHYNGTTNQVLFRAEDLKDTRNFWVPANAQFLLEARNPRAPGALLYFARTLGDPRPPWMDEAPLPEPNRPILRCRVIDTRIGLGGPPVAIGASYRVFPVAGLCGIPVDAKSVRGFLTTMDATASGSLLIGHHTGALRKSADIKRSAPSTARVSTPLGPRGYLLGMAGQGHPGVVNVVFEVDGYGALGPNPPLPPSACRVRWGSHTMSSAVAAKSNVLVSVTFYNIGDRTWPDMVLGTPGDRSTSVRLSHDWYPAGSDLSVKAGIRSNLPHPVRPGQSATVVADLATPSAPGEYRLVFDLLQENVDWFTSKGATQLIVPVTVQ